MIVDLDKAAFTTIHRADASAPAVNLEKDLISTVEGKRSSKQSAVCLED